MSEKFDTSSLEYRVAEAVHPEWAGRWANVEQNLYDHLENKAVREALIRRGWQAKKAAKIIAEKAIKRFSINENWSDDMIILTIRRYGRDLQLTTLKEVLESE